MAPLQLKISRPAIGINSKQKVSNKQQKQKQQEQEIISSPPTPILKLSNKSNIMKRKVLESSYIGNELKDMNSFKILKEKINVEGKIEISDKVKGKRRKIDRDDKLEVNEEGEDIMNVLPVKGSNASGIKDFTRLVSKKIVEKSWKLFSVKARKEICTTLQEEIVFKVLCTLKEPLRSDFQEISKEILEEIDHYLLQATVPSIRGTSDLLFSQDLLSKISSMEALLASEFAEISSLETQLKKENNSLVVGAPRKVTKASKKAVSDCDFGDWD